MKKSLLLFVLVVTLTLAFSACKSDKKEEFKVEEKTKVADNVVYQCPMDCEDGKSYTKPGTCPVCKMDLKEKEVNLE
ncbi:MAG: hypothetical protein CR989_00115 [Flavobacteriales bacterium]|nr:MAG: hypothetical protein CR989_00115 [Flavobacteriales bacterium]